MKRINRNSAGIGLVALVFGSLLLSCDNGSSNGTSNNSDPVGPDGENAAISANSGTIQLSEVNAQMLQQGESLTIPLDDDEGVLRYQEANDTVSELLELTMAENTITWFSRADGLPKRMTQGAANSSPVGNWIAFSQKIGETVYALAADDGDGITIDIEANGDGFSITVSTVGTVTLDIASDDSMNSYIRGEWNKVGGEGLGVRWYFSDTFFYLCYLAPCSSVTNCVHDTVCESDNKFSYTVGATGRLSSAKFQEDFELDSMQLITENSGLGITLYRGAEKCTLLLERRLPITEPEISVRHEEIIGTWNFTGGTAGEEGEFGMWVIETEKIWNCSRSTSSCSDPTAADCVPDTICNEESWDYTFDESSARIISGEISLQVELIDSQHMKVIYPDDSYYLMERINRDL